jgi:glycerophosphoryl diester phosphodiesterase
VTRKDGSAASCTPMSFALWHSSVVYPYRRLLGIACIVALPACTSAPASTAPCPPSAFASKRTLVIAHAGGEGLGPANTIEAMRLSMAAGADVNDADVHITSDGVLVAIHDDTVDATTDGSGVVGDMTFAQLQALDAGAKFAGPNNDFPFRGKGVRIPTIEDVLTAFPKTLTSLEFKVHGDAPKAMCTLLRRLNQTKNVYMSSKTDDMIYEFNSLCPEVVSTVTDALVPIMREARTTGSAWCSPVPIGQPPYREGAITAESLKWSHDHGLATYTWTVDNPKDLSYLVNVGVDAIYTTRPDIARKIVDQLKPDSTNGSRPVAIPAATT